MKKKKSKNSEKPKAKYGYSGQKTKIAPNRTMKHYLDMCFGYRRRCWNRLLACYLREKEINPEVKIDKELMKKVRQDGLQEDWEDQMPAFIWTEVQNTLAETIYRHGKANFKTKKKTKDSFVMDYSRIRGKNQGYFIRRGTHEYFRITMGRECDIDDELRWMKIHEDVEFFPDEGDELSEVSISKVAGIYMASFSIKLGQPRLATKGTGKVGIDPGIHNLMTLSDGTTMNFTSAAKKKLAKLDKRKRHYENVMANKRKTNKNWKKSKRYAKAKTKHQRVCLKISNIRTDAIRKMTTEIVKKYKWVYWEDVKSKNMVKNHKLAKAIYGACWGKIKTMLKQKCEMHGGTFIKVPTSYSATQTCSECGERLPKSQRLTLKDRTFICPHCGHTEDRDLNAAKRIAQYEPTSKKEQTCNAAMLAEAQPSE